MWDGERACEGRLPGGSVIQTVTRKMCIVNQVRKEKQGTGLGRGTTCVKVQRQDGMDNWKKLLTANSYTFFKFPLKHVPSPCGAVPKLFQGDLHPLLFPEDLQCLFLADSLHYIVIYLDCNILCLSFLLKTIHSLKAGNYVWFCFVTATSKQWYYPFISPNERGFFSHSSLGEDWSAVPPTQGPQIPIYNLLTQCYMLSFP